MLSKHFRRQVNELYVFCRRKDKGCAWQGALSDFKCHIRSCPMSDTQERLELPVYVSKTIYLS